MNGEELYFPIQLRESIRTLEESICKAMQPKIQVEEKVLQAFSKQIAATQGFQNSIQALQVALAEAYRPLMDLQSTSNDQLQKIAEKLSAINWELLDELDDDDEVPQEVLSPIQDLAGDATNSSRSLTKSDLFGFLSLLLALFQMFFGSPYEWCKEAESNAEMEQYRLTQQEALDTLKDIRDVLQKSEVVRFDSVKPNVVDNGPDQKDQISSCK